MSGKRMSLALATAVAALSVLTLTGYAFKSVPLVAIRTDWQTMSVSTALLCLGLSASLWADASGRLGHSRIIGAVILVFSAVLLAVDTLTGHDVVSPAILGMFAGEWPLNSETSPATAGCAGLLAAGSLFRPRAQPATAFAIAVMLVSGLAVLGYCYGVRDLYALSPFRTMSFRTAVSLFGLALGFLVSNEENGVSALVLDRSLTGRATRRQLGFLVLPPLMAAVLLKATSAERLGPGAAMAFLVVFTVAPLAALVLRDARSLSRLDAEQREKRRSDEAKLSVERRYRTLFTGLDSGFCVVEMKFGSDNKALDYRFLEINPAFARQTGLNDAEGRWMRDLAPAHEQHWFDLYGRVALTGEPARVEFEAVALGRHFDVSTFRIDEPELHHVAILFTDITARKRAELDLRALNETLERRVADRAAELEKTQEALRQSQRMEAIGQLTGGVAHDFNNLLTVIQGSAEMLSRPNLKEERRTRFTQAIVETSSRAAKLTNQLLAFARRQSLRPETFDVGESLVEAMTVLAPLAGPKIDLDLSVPSTPCFVQADRSQFDAAIVNMVVNARDAMEGEGRIAISVSVASDIPAQRSHPAVRGDFMAVRIEDSGSGIAAENLAQIFEPFYTTKGVGTGTGLGLSQVFGFTKQSGGDVHVDSVLGKGATFTLYLPREYISPVPSRSEPEGEMDGNGLRVLVVEDNAHVGEFAVQSLAELGYRSALASDAEQALAMLTVDRGRFDVVFSDVVMPGRSGIEMAEEIRGLYPDLPVVLTSGYSHVLAKNGTYGFELLHKPYSIDQLSRVLRKVLTWAEGTRDATVQPSSVRGQVDAAGPASMPSNHSA